MTSCCTVCTDPTRAFWIEFWPAALHLLSQRQVGVQLSTDQAHSLGRLNGVGLPVFLNSCGAGLDALADALATAMEAFPQGAFVRLGSRSPKDTAAWLGCGGRARSAAEALALLGGGSLRLFQDLRLCVQNGWQPWVFLREWREMAEHAEWRGFLRDGVLVGLSQYHVAAVQRDADVQALHNGGAQALVVLGARVQAALGQRDLVFDAWLRPDGRAELIELNPSGPCTDTALFACTAPAMDATLRWRGLQGLVSLPLALVQSAATTL